MANGIISANGENGEDGSGGGSGGSIYISGKMGPSTGNITANGGNGSISGPNLGGGGAGGRIAYEVDTIAPFAGITTAYGGVAPSNASGGPGTVYIYPVERLTVDNNGITGPTSSSDSSVASNAAWIFMNNPYQIDQLLLRGNGQVVVSGTGNISQIFFYTLPIYLFTIIVC
jgi:hypothetical protein